MRFLAILLCAGLIPAGVVGAQAQKAERSGDQPGITKEQAAKIIEELQMIRMLLQKQIDDQPIGTSKATGRVSSPSKTLGDVGRHVIGGQKAPVTLVEFVDLQCPFCVEFQREVFPEFKRKYIDTGIVRFVAFDFPLPSHAYAMEAAVFARCAERQGKYWEVRASFLTQIQLATREAILQVAAANHLDRNSLETCMQDSEIGDQIKREQSVAAELGVVGTPTFLLGKTSGSGTTGVLIEGSPGLGVLEDMIVKVLGHEGKPEESRAASH